MVSLFLRGLGAKGRQRCPRPLPRVRLPGDCWCCSSCKLGQVGTWPRSLGALLPNIQRGGDEEHPCRWTLLTSMHLLRWSHHPSPMSRSISILLHATHPSPITAASPASPYQALSIQTSPRVRQQTPGRGLSQKTHYLPSPTCFFSPKHAPVSQAVHHGYSPQQSLSGILAVGCIGKFRAPVLDRFQSSQGVFKAFAPPARGGITSRLTTFYLNIFNHRNGREKKKKRINLLLLFSSNTSLVLGAVHILSLCIGDDIYHGCTSFTFFFYIYIFSPAGS